MTDVVARNSIGSVTGPNFFNLVSFPGSGVARKGGGSGASTRLSPAVGRSISTSLSPPAATVWQPPVSPDRPWASGAIPPPSTRPAPTPRPRCARPVLRAFRPFRAEWCFPICPSSSCRKLLLAQAPTPAHGLPIFSQFLFPSLLHSLLDLLAPRRAVLRDAQFIPATGLAFSVWITRWK